MEPQWNPFLEYQAMARALRIGQDHQVTIIRFITENTIEHVGEFAHEEQCNH
jgi:SNF2 family DNA or RNA helicase